MTVPNSRRAAAGWWRILPLCLVLSACASGGIVSPDAAPDAVPVAPPKAISPAGAVDAATPPKRRFTLFGRSDGNPRVQGVARDVPFGEIVTVCDVPKAKMGKEVARSHGPGKYRLFDTDSSSDSLRPQFLIGFKDGCARQFSAALVLFGSASVHEATRYNPLNKSPYSRSDIAYEKLKGRICGVAKGVPCPENRIARLNRDVAFVSVYKGFGDSGQWLEIILNDGKLVTLEKRGS